MEVIEPFHGRIYDPACGSGGMFVQSASFVENHRRNPNAEISVYGQEKTAETVRLCKMNLAVHGLSGDVREANSYYEDLHKGPGRFDFVMTKSTLQRRSGEHDLVETFLVLGLQHCGIYSERRFYAFHEYWRREREFSALAAGYGRIVV